MSKIWDALIEGQNGIIDIFNAQGIEIQEPGMENFNKEDSGWLNRIWKNDHVRRAHIDVVDARASKGLWMMHVCVFPTLDNGGPIYGFDVVSGAKKMTGAFHDFSPSSGGYDHPMIEGYREAVRDFIPSKPRELPQWAKNIFTESMVAAGNVSSEDEAVAIVRLALENLEYYFAEIGNYAYSADRDETIKAQNWYCDNQTQNPHTPKVMKSLGLDEDAVDVFCKDMLFPKIA